MDVRGGGASQATSNDLYDDDWAPQLNHTYWAPKHHFLDDASANHTLIDDSYAYGDDASARRVGELSGWPQSTKWWQLSHWTQGSERVEFAIFCVVSIVLFWFVFRWFVDRCTDGLTAEERKLNRELRERSQRYRAFKNEEAQREKTGLLPAKEEQESTEEVV